MQPNKDFPDNLSVQQAMALASTPAGQQLIALLQKSGGSQLQDVMEKAAAGDYSLAKNALSAVLSTPDAQKLLRQLGG